MTKEDCILNELPICTMLDGFDKNTRQAFSAYGEFLNSNPALGCQLLLSISEILARRTRELVNKVNATWELS